MCERIELLAKAESALTELTNECHGSCAWMISRHCYCGDEFWPAIEAIRKLREEENA